MIWPSMKTLMLDLASRTRFRVPAALGASIFLHLVLCTISLYMNGHPRPVLNSWSNIVRHNELFAEKREAVYPAGMPFSSHTARVELFWKKVPVELPMKQGVEPLKNEKGLPTTQAARPEQPLYLWEQKKVFSAETEESIPYKAYVSGNGKVLVLFPQKLPLNSRDAIELQQYLKESSVFLNDKLCWTNLDGVVK